MKKKKKENNFVQALRQFVLGILPHQMTEVQTEGNEPILEPETIIIDGQTGVIRFAGTPNEEIFKWNDLSDDEIDFLKDYFPELNI